MTVRTAIVLVSHSERLAAGTLELAQQMAPDVKIVAVGGQTGGGLGTSFDLVSDALRTELDTGRDVAVLADLGSAMLTVDSAIELLDPSEAVRVRLADAPFVEGAVAAAVTAQGGAGLDAVAESAEQAGSTFASYIYPSPATAGGAGASKASVPVALTVARTVTVRNTLGLHARPAAVLARLVSGLDASVLVDGVNGASVLELMKLGATGGQEISLSATGPGAQHAVDAVAEAIESGFGEA